MLSIGFDPSLRAYGWAVHDDSVKGLKRRVSSGHEGTLPSTVPVARFLHFQAMVKDLLGKHDVDVVGIESPAYEAGPFQSIHFGLMMFSLVPIFEARKDVVMFDPSTLKYLAREDPAKKGAMGKLDMQRKVQVDTMDTKVIDNNEADAYLVAKFAARMKSLATGLIRPGDLTGTELRAFVERTKSVKSGLGRKKKRVGYAFRENSRFFRFSQVPRGSVSLPSKSGINPDVLTYLESLEE
jgi:Holliday junction resolvasome RuvABC endonuclease subunit